MGCQTREVRHQIRLCELVAIVVRMTMSIWVAACDRRDAVQVIRLDELVVAKDELVVVAKDWFFSPHDNLPRFIQLGPAERSTRGQPRLRCRRPMFRGKTCCC